MPSVSKVAIQMMIVFALVCVWAVSSGWKQQVVRSFEIHTNEAAATLSAQKNVHASGNGGILTQVSGADMDPVTSIAE